MMAISYKAFNSVHWTLVAILLVAVPAAIYAWRSGSDVKKMAIEGSVTLDGRSLSNAVIVFIPDVSNTRARKTGAEVIGGRYQMSEQDGVTPGSYRVEISPYVSPLQQSKPDVANSPPQIPSKYHRRSELTAIVSETPGQMINFSLSSRP